MTKGLENLPCKGRLKECPWRREGPGGPHHSILVIERQQLQRGRRLSFHKEPHENTRGNEYKL